MRSMKKILFAVFVLAICAICVSFAFAEDGHDFRAVKTVKPTCTMQGYTVYKCIDCNVEKNDDFVDALGHTEDEPLITNEISATCSRPDSHDEYIYCTVCYTRLSVKHIVGETVDHVDGNEDGYCDTCGLTIGDTSYKCPCKCHRTGISGSFFKLTRMILGSFSSNQKPCCYCEEKFSGISLGNDIEVDTSILESIDLGVIVKFIKKLFAGA